jgi:flagellar hook-length control protein FliK
MIAAEPLLVARPAEPLTAVPAGAAVADAAAGDGFALALAQMIEGDAAAVAVEPPAVVPVVASGAAAMLDDLGHMAALMPEQVPVPIPVQVAAPMQTLPVAVVPDVVLPETGVPEADALAKLGAGELATDVPEAAAVIVDGALADGVPAVMPETAEAVATETPVERAEEDAAPEVVGETARPEAAVLPLVSLPRVETAVAAVAVAAPQGARQAAPKTEDKSAAADAPVVAQAQPKLPRGAKPAKDTAPAEPTEAKAEGDLVRAAGKDKGKDGAEDDKASDPTRPRPVLAEAVAIPAAGLRQGDDLSKAAPKPEAALGTVEAPAPASGSVTTAQASGFAALTGAGPVAMDRPGWDSVIAERIAAELSGDGTQIELDLTPEKLGHLKITLDLSSGEAQVRFVTETPEAARLIQQNEHRLTEALARAGLSLGGHETTSRDPQGDRSGRGSGGGGFVFERAAEAATGRVPGAVPSGIVNLIA